jgi:hypothetical protein
MSRTPLIELIHTGDLFQGCFAVARKWFRRRGAGNHKSGSKAGVAGVYNRAVYLEESRKALNRYANYVLSIVS